MDGYITIGTKLDTSKLDRQIQELENKLTVIERKQEENNTATARYQNELSAAKREVQSLEKEYERLSREVQKVDDIMAKKQAGKSLTPQEFMDIQGYQGLVSQTEKVGTALDKAYKTQFNLTEKLSKAKTKQQELAQQANIYKSKLQQVNYQKQTKGIEEMKNSMKEVGKNVGQTIAKVGKLALALFAVRSAYSAVRQASSMLAQYDDQYAADLEYMKYALVQVLAPVLKQIVDLAYQLMLMIARIVFFFTGINMFANSSAEAFNSMKNSANGIKKALQSTPFDEMNVLTENGVSGNNMKLPSYDLSNLNLEEPEIFRKIREQIQDTILNFKLFCNRIETLWIVVTTQLSITFDKTLNFVKGAWNGFAEMFNRTMEAMGLNIRMKIFDTTDTTEKRLSEMYKKVADKNKEVSEIVSQYSDDTKRRYLDMASNVNIGFDGIEKSGKDAFNTLFEKTDEFTKNGADGFDELERNADGSFKNIKKNGKDSMNELGNTFSSSGTTLADKFSGSFKTVINTVLSYVELRINQVADKINNLFYGITNSSIGQALGIPNIRVQRVQLPRLAVGGIINMPNRGVPVGGAIAGEAGREGVIPLTDSQAMETLGEAIGRYITINANITNTMNGRVISRQLQQIQNDRNFAYNS